MSQDLISFMLTSRDEGEIICSEEYMWKLDHWHCKVLYGDCW